MQVKLVGFTPDPEKLIYQAARSSELLEPELEYEPGRASKLIAGLIRSYATSPLEHASFTFLITGASRALTHQLVRHRIASYTQLSQRYAIMRSKDVVIPPSIQSHPQARAEFDKLMEACWSTYNWLLAQGIPAEDARYVLPNAAKTNIYVTMNARSLLNFFNQRACKRAQWEIRELAWKMLELVEQAAPSIFKNAGPYCVGGYCPFGLISKCEVYHQRVKGRRSIRTKLAVTQELQISRA